MTCSIQETGLGSMTNYNVKKNSQPIIWRHDRKNDIYIGICAATSKQQLTFDWWILLWTTYLGLRVRESNMMKNPLLALISLSFNGMSSAVQYNGLLLVPAFSLLLLVHMLILQTAVIAALRVVRKRDISFALLSWIVDVYKILAVTVLTKSANVLAEKEATLMPRVYNVANTKLIVSQTEDFLQCYRWDLPVTFSRVAEWPYTLSLSSQ